jgi:hypothetical protein
MPDLLTLSDQIDVASRYPVGWALYCGRTFPRTDHRGRPWICTRDADLQGPHVAHTSDGRYALAMTPERSGVRR